MYSTKVVQLIIKSTKESSAVIKQCRQSQRFISYTQGQYISPKIREYFYYIDHQGMLFLDDTKIKNFTSCFKDKKFLQFFFSRLKINDSNCYQKDFPFLSLCGHERNYIRCDDLPIVFTHVFSDEKNNIEKLSYAHAGDLLNISFEPEKIYMTTATGRVYHPAPSRYGGIGLIRSKLAIELSKYFEFEDSNNNNLIELQKPIKFTWNKVEYKLNSDWVSNTILFQK